MIHFLVPREQEFGIREYLAMWGPELTDRFSIIHYEELPAHSAMLPGPYILASLDQLTSDGLRLVGELERQLRAAGSAVRLLNSTAATLHRYELLDGLWRAGLNRHRAVRAAEDLGGLTSMRSAKAPSTIFTGSFSPRCGRSTSPQMPRSPSRFAITRRASRAGTA